MSTTTKEDAFDRGFRSGPTDDGIGRNGTDNHSFHLPLFARHTGASRPCEDRHGAARPYLAIPRGRDLPPHLCGGAKSPTSKEERIRAMFDPSHGQMWR